MHTMVSGVVPLCSPECSYAGDVTLSECEKFATADGVLNKIVQYSAEKMTSPMLKVDAHEHCLEKKSFCRLKDKTLGMSFLI